MTSLRVVAARAARVRLRTRRTTFRALCTRLILLGLCWPTVLTAGLAPPPEDPGRNESSPVAADPALGTLAEQPGPAPVTDPYWRHCQGSAPKAGARPAVYPPREGAVTEISAESFEATGERFSVFRGNVIAKRADQRIAADQITYDQENDFIRAEGGVRYAEKNLRIRSASADFDLPADRATIEDVEFFIDDQHARGTASKVDLKGSNVSRYKDGTYTTCNPGNNDWQIRAGKLTIDQEEGKGVARNAVLAIKGVPVFYSPYMSFPTDDRRKSGFLAPTFGTSSASGTDVQIPYYWNIAPARDATITPRYLGDRGVLLGSEYRYMGKTHSGIALAEFLPNDNEADRNRWFGSLKHSGRPAAGWRVGIDASYASDDDYFRDLSATLKGSSTRNLQQRADLTYSRSRWSLLTRVQTFQTLEKNTSPTSRPYQRLPQFLFNMRLPDNRYGLKAQLGAEAVYFDREETVTSSRISMYPSISLPLEAAAAYLTPKVTLRGTFYNFNDEDPGTPSTKQRILPLVSLDGGIFLERNFNLGSANFIQTLEPRLFYLYVPNDNQEDIPTFDTSEFQFSFSQLFRENRFSGGDRVGDANQLTVALTSRILDENSGAEIFRGSIGQIFYFRDLEVTLPGRTPVTNSSSDLAAELVGRVSSSFFTRATLQWDPHREVTPKSVFQVHYRPDQDRILNFSYRRTRGTTEQIDTSLRWPLGRNWHAVGRWAYSLLDDTTIGTLAGFEYESCCWIARLVANQHINDDDEATNTTYLFQLELKGLTSLGESVDDLLEQTILGYH